MPKKKLAYFTSKELTQTLKRTKVLTIIQTIIVLIMIVMAILLTGVKGISVFTFLPLFFIPMVVLGFIQIKSLKKEIQKRKIK
ncbi:hypothetical protein [Tenacibaculum sp. UWU-22]|uniref:hypothetical protein n=1 Tax=Tenacibaculum sp. UWU-22 TaxID=3234187 RepID=UPI0034DAECA5